MRKRLEDLTIQDDFIFGKVFEDTELAKQLIDVILPELHIKELNAVIRQHSLPCFLVEHMVDKIHRQLIDGKASELAEAQAKEKKEESR